MRRFLLFLSIIFVSHLIASESKQKDHLILFFDINKSIIAFDPTENKPLEIKINELLSENTYAQWDKTCQTAISFADYRKNTADNEKFLSIIQREWPSLYEPLRRKYVAARDKALHDGLFVHSFLYLLDYLAKENISYSLILRSYDDNVEKAMLYLMRHRPIQFISPLNFSGGVLEDANTHIYDMHIVYEIFKRTPAIGVKDDKALWLRHNKNKGYGKPFPVNLDDPEVISCFFDASLSLDETDGMNSITPIDIRTNAIVDTKALVRRKMLIKVDPLQALMNDNYFIDQVKEAIRVQKSYMD